MKRITSLVGVVGLALVAGCAVDPGAQESEQTGITEEALSKGVIEPADPTVPTKPTKTGPTGPTQPAPPTTVESPAPVARTTAPAYRAMAPG